MTGVLGVPSQILTVLPVSLRQRTRFKLRSHQNVCAAPLPPNMMVGMHVDGLHIRTVHCRMVLLLAYDPYMSI